jgi:hypothetical protein
VFSCGLASWPASFRLSSKKTLDRRPDCSAICG